MILLQLLRWKLKKIVVREMIGNFIEQNNILEDYKDIKLI